MTRCKQLTRTSAGVVRRLTTVREVLVAGADCARSSPQAFVEYWRRVRMRTMAVAERVPAARVDYSPGSGVMSIGDLLRHLAVTERWLFVEVACGRPARYLSHGAELASTLPQMLAMLQQCHSDSVALLQAMTHDDWRNRVTVPGGATIEASKWLRAMVEHEAHHRGQLYLLLRLCNIPTPPVFGLTSEQVRALSGAPRKARRARR